MAQSTLHPKDHPRNNHEVSTNQVENKDMIKWRHRGKGQSCLQSLLSHDFTFLIRAVAPASVPLPWELGEKGAAHLHFVKQALPLAMLACELPLATDVSFLKNKRGECWLAPPPDLLPVATCLPFGPQAPERSHKAPR